MGLQRESLFAVLGELLLELDKLACGEEALVQVKLAQRRVGEDGNEQVLGLAASAHRGRKVVEDSGQRVQRVEGGQCAAQTVDNRTAGADWIVEEVQLDESRQPAEQSADVFNAADAQQVARKVEGL